MKKDFAIPLFFSLLLHIGFFYFASPRNRKVVYMALPVELSFYNPAPAVVAAPAAASKKNERIIVPGRKDDIVVPKGKAKKKKDAKKATAVPRSHVPPVPLTPQKGSPQGVPGGSRPGSPISLDTKNFPYAYYTNLIVKKIGSNWKWSSGFGQMRALIYFKILRDGSLGEATVKDSSGDRLFDQQALRSVQMAGPFPPLPGGYPDEDLGVYFEFAFGE